MRLTALLMLLAAAATAQPAVPPDAQLVSFPGGSLTLRGYLYKPAGAGPFPAVLWNHGSEKLPGWQPDLAAFYTSHGFVFFLPHRHGHGKSPGEYIVDLTEKARASGDAREFRQAVVRLHQVYNADVAAAVDWLRAQPFVDPRRIAMSGVSYGGIQTLLAAEKGMGVRAFVAFAPAALSWANTELRDRLLAAVRNARAPVFLLQAANDYSIGPSQILGPEVRRRGPPNRAKLYSAFGATAQDGHGAFACRAPGIRIWGDDVLAFLRSVMGPR